MNGSRPFAFAVSIRLNTVAVAFAPDGVFQNRKRFFFSYLHPFLRWLFSHVAISFNDFVETFFHISHWLAMCCDLTLTIIRRIYVDKVDFALMHFF